jgi:hypothetical protein
MVKNIRGFQLTVDKSEIDALVDYYFFYCSGAAQIGHSSIKSHFQIDEAASKLGTTVSRIVASAVGPTKPTRLASGRTCVARGH